MIKSDRRNEFLESLSVRSFDRNKEGTSTCYLVVLVMSFERKQKISHRIPSLKDDLSEQIFKAPFV